MEAEQNKHRFARWSWLPLVCALLPAVAAGFANRAEVAPLIPSQHPAPLTFASRLFTHGEEPVEPTLVVQSEFRFRNDGEHPIRISNVRTSCDCMQPRLSQKVLQPGEIGSLVVPIETIRQNPGRREYDLFLDYEVQTAEVVGNVATGGVTSGVGQSDSTREFSVPLQIRAIIPERTVVVQPKQLFISQRSDRPAEFEVKINDYREQPLRITDVQSSNALIKGQLRPTTEPVIQQVGHSDAVASSSEVVIRGEVAGGMAAGRHFFLLSATTDDPQFSVITVPVIVNGPPHEVPEALQPQAMPRELNLYVDPNRGATKGAQSRVTIPSDWDVSHMTTWPEQLQATFEEAVPVAPQQKAVLLKVQLEDLPPAAVTDGVVQLHANDGRDLVTIRVRFYRP